MFGKRLHKIEAVIQKIRKAMQGLSDQQRIRDQGKKALEDALLADIENEGKPTLTGKELTALRDEVTFSEERIQALNGYLKTLESDLRKALDERKQGRAAEIDGELVRIKEIERPEWTERLWEQRGYLDALLMHTENIRSGFHFGKPDDETPYLRGMDKARHDFKLDGVPSLPDQRQSLLTERHELFHVKYQGDVLSLIAQYKAEVSV